MFQVAGEYEAEYCQTIRERTAERDEDADRISGLRLGADDYLSKTISGAFLAARINALIRRVETLLSGAAHLCPPRRQARV